MLKANPQPGVKREEDPLYRAHRENEVLVAENELLRKELHEAHEKRDEILRSLSWRLTAPLRLAGGWALRAAGKARRKLKSYEFSDATLSNSSYREWIAQYDSLRESSRAAIRTRIETLSRRPLISIVIAVHDTPAALLRESIDSIRRQLYPQWQIAIADDASTTPHVARVLGGYAWDPRIRSVRRERQDGAVAAGNEALALADGEFVAFLDPGDTLAETALFEVAVEINSSPGAELIYTDEDRMDAKGRRCDPRFKTGWNPDLLLTHDYIGSLAVYSRELLDRGGGLRESCEQAYRHDLALRATSATDASRIRHIPAVLCHRHESNRDEDAAASRNAVREHLQALNPGATVTAAPDAPARHRILWPDVDLPVSIIVPTRDRPELLERCLEGVLRRTDYPSIEVLVMDNGSREDRTQRLFERLQGSANVRVIPCAGEFNWSAINNAAAEVASGELLVLLNNDTQVADPGWLRELARHAARPEVGAVGAKLLFADGSVQHAGVWLGPSGWVRHLLRLSGGRAPGYLDQLIVTRNLSAVTGACMAVRRDVLRQVGGFDPALPVVYGDIDLCLRLIEAGYRIVWTPYAQLLHLESASRGSGESRWRQEESEKGLFRRRWKQPLDYDPFFNPNLELIGEEKLALSAPPRHQRPWEQLS